MKQRARSLGRRGGAAALAAGLLAATGALAQEGLFQRDHGKIAVPTASAMAAAAPPEGVGPGGLDFGRWRGANVAGYGESLEARLRARLAGKPVSAARADLEANGFACLEARERPGAARVPALECRLAAVDGGCEREWWAVIEEPLAPVKAGYDAMCGRR
jgi:hypothetical protein